MTNLWPPQDEGVSKNDEDDQDENDNTNDDGDGDEEEGKYDEDGGEGQEEHDGRFLTLPVLLGFALTRLQKPLIPLCKM